jgi:hypothetical protein
MPKGRNGERRSGTLIGATILQDRTTRALFGLAPYAQAPREAHCQIRHGIGRASVHRIDGSLMPIAAGFFWRRIAIGLLACRYIDNRFSKLVGVSGAFWGSLSGTP